MSASQENLALAFQTHNTSRGAKDPPAAPKDTDSKHSHAPAGEPVLNPRWTFPLGETILVPVVRTGKPSACGHGIGMYCWQASLPFPTKGEGVNYDDAWVRWQDALQKWTVSLYPADAVDTLSDRVLQLKQEIEVLKKNVSDLSTMNDALAKRISDLEAKKH